MAKKMVTHRLVKISAGSERLEIRRYEYADEWVDLNGVQEHWGGRMYQATVRGRSRNAWITATHFCG